MSKFEEIKPLERPSSQRGYYTKEDYFNEGSCLYRGCHKHHPLETIEVGKTEGGDPILVWADTRELVKRGESIEGA